MGTPWRAKGVRASIVHRYGAVERPVEPCRVPSCQNRVPTDTCRNPDLAREEPMSPDGSLDCPVSVYNWYTDPYGTIRDPDMPSWGPTGPNLTPQTPTPDGV